MPQVYDLTKLSYDELRLMKAQIDVQLSKTELIQRDYVYGNIKQSIFGNILALIGLGLIFKYLLDSGSGDYFEYKISWYLIVGVVTFLVGMWISSAHERKEKKLAKEFERLCGIKSILIIPIDPISPVDDLQSADHL